MVEIAELNEKYSLPTFLTHSPALCPLNVLITTTYIP